MKGSCASNRILSNAISGATTGAVQGKIDESPFILKAYDRLLRYNSSTFFLAHGVLLKNFKLDLMLGSSIKHLIVIRRPNSCQPYCSTKWFRIISSVTPCKGFFGCSTVMPYSHHVYSRNQLPHSLRGNGRSWS